MRSSPCFLGRHFRRLWTNIGGDVFYRATPERDRPATAISRPVIGQNDIYAGRRCSRRRRSIFARPLRRSNRRRSSYAPRATILRVVRLRTASNRASDVGCGARRRRQQRHHPATDSVRGPALVPAGAGAMSTGVPHPPPRDRPSGHDLVRETQKSRARRSPEMSVISTGLLVARAREAATSRPHSSRPRRAQVQFPRDRFQQPLGARKLRAQRAGQRPPQHRVAPGSPAVASTPSDVFLKDGARVAGIGPSPPSSSRVAGALRRVGWAMDFRSASAVARPPFDHRNSNPRPPPITAHRRAGVRDERRTRGSRQRFRRLVFRTAPVDRDAQSATGTARPNALALDDVSAAWGSISVSTPARAHHRSAECGAARLLTAAGRARLVGHRRRARQVAPAAVEATIHREGDVPRESAAPISISQATRSVTGLSHP